MSEINLQIDGKKVTASEGMTILDAARSVNISIPTLCDHEKLHPYGACRVCVGIQIAHRGPTSRAYVAIDASWTNPRKFVE